MKKGSIEEGKLPKKPGLSKKERLIFFWCRWILFFGILLFSGLMAYFKYTNNHVVFELVGVSNAVCIMIFLFSWL